MFSALEKTLDSNLFSLQGGESRNLFRLFRTCIRTARVRKLFRTSKILTEFSCGKVQVPCLCKQKINIEMCYVMRCSFLHNLEQRLKTFSLCSRLSGKIQRP